MAPTLTPLITTLVPEERLGRANAISGGMFALAVLVSPAIVTEFIAQGLAGMWIGVMSVGALSVTLVALRLRDRLADSRHRRTRAAARTLPGAVRLLSRPERGPERRLGRPRRGWAHAESSLLSQRT